MSSCSPQKRSGKQLFSGVHTIYISSESATSTLKGVGGNGYYDVSVARLEATTSVSRLLAIRFVSSLLQMYLYCQAEGTVKGPEAKQHGRQMIALVERTGRCAC